ncbi:MAG: hypothetical protein OXC62_14945 [Aestuariivita sp.]|nr:hypothetical protein [Aestuariivita sp.]
MDENSTLLPKGTEEEEQRNLKEKVKNRIQTQLDSQTWQLRTLAFYGSVIVILGITLLEILIVRVLLKNLKINDFEVINATLATIVIAPIASITAITIAILVGVFRRYRGNELSNASGVLNRITAEN